MNEFNARFNLVCIQREVREEILMTLTKLRLFRIQSSAAACISSASLLSRRARLAKMLGKEGGGGGLPCERDNNSQAATITQRRLPRQQQQHHQRRRRRRLHDYQLQRFSVSCRVADSPRQGVLVVQPLLGLLLSFWYPTRNVTGVQVVAAAVAAVQN